MVKKVGTRIRIESENILKTSESEHGVMEQFTREFAALLQLTKEKQSKELTSENFGNSRDNTHQEVAFFGDITQKLVPLVDRVLQATPDQITTTKKTELLLIFGDKFYHIEEFRAASTYFYENVILLDERTENDPQQGVLERILASTTATIQKRSHLDGQTYVRSLFGVAMCCFHVQKRSDEFLRYPGTLEKIIEALTFLRLGMEVAVTMERQYSGQFAWLTLNGTVLIYSIAKPLQAMGFSKEIVAYLKWSLLAMESAVTLSTTKYITWRLQLGTAICDCYENLALKEVVKADQYTKSAVACAAYIQQAVQRLRKEEELDMPLPVEVQRILTEAETTSAMLVSRTKAAADHQAFTKSRIVTAFPTVRDQIRVAIDGMEILSREVKQRRGGQGTFTLIPSTPPANEAMVELFDFIMEIVTPMLNSLVAEEESSTIETSTLDPVNLPISFHLVIIRYCFQLAKPAEEMVLLIKSAHERLLSTPSNTDAVMIKCLLELFEALHEVQQSWIRWEELSEDDRLQSTSKPRVQLPVSGVSIPAPEFLTKLSKTMQDFIFHGDGAISRINQDLMASVALQLWREFASPMAKELDTTEPSQLSKPLVRLTCELMLAIHVTFIAVKFEDLLLHGHVCLRLATLLSMRGKARRGSQVVRQCLERINLRRSELVNFSSHFHSVVEKGSATALSNSSFSCAIDDLSGSTALNGTPTEAINARDHVGIPGTGSQLGGLSQDLCCIQIDLSLLLYRLELQAATTIDVLPLTSTTASTVTPGTSSTVSTILLATEAKLVEECHQNGYAKVLLNIQRLAHPQKSAKERRMLADESIQLLQQIENQEKQLRRQLTPPTTQDPSTESAVPAAPIVISRSSSAITVKVVEYQPTLPSLRKKRVMYYMVFAKSAGAGTAVSLNSNRLPGTASPVYPPRLRVTISGLLPNESYVFAVAAFDNKHQLIHSIGETSEPVVALNPLPLTMCYGYLAKACYDTQLTVRANTAANYLYNTVVSHICAGRPSWMANPFYRQALKRDAVAQFPIPVLNLCIQALLILCHNEPGDLERDGKLVTSSDLETQSLTATQIKALEDSRKISMAIEIACATDNQEAIRVLSFKGYRLLLPLLHLKGGCDGLTFAALVTYYQALHVIPNEKWDIDTRSICARVGFELFRIAQDTNDDISRVVLPLILTADENQHKAQGAHFESAMRNEEDESLREVVALFKLASTAKISMSARDATTPAASLRPKGVPVPVSKDKSQSNTPQDTPRKADKAEAGGKLPSLNELLQSTGNDLGKVFLILEQHNSSDRRTVEFGSKICGAVLTSGSEEVSQVEKLLSSLKVTGEISSQFRATLSSLGGGSLLPELIDVEVETSEAHPLENATSETGAGADDDYLYRWCGELFFIQSVLLVRSSLCGILRMFPFTNFLDKCQQYRKITKRCDTINTVNTANGPETEDCTYALIHGGENNNDDKAGGTKQDDTLAPEAVPHEGERVDLQSGEVGHGDIDPVSSKEDLDQLFDELLEKSAACCKLFRLANSWQGLQTVTQQLWNAVWHAWVSPSHMSTPTRLTHISNCIDALLDMVDLAVNGTGDVAPFTTVMPTNTATTASTKRSMSLSTVVSAATNALNIDQTWFARLMTYSLRVFCSSQDWKNIVQKGSRYHFLCGSTPEGSRCSEKNFSILIYAQNQIVSHQESLVKAAEQELGEYVTAFQEQESKKKKKKSRLFVEEVLSPEEIMFRVNKQEMERRIQGFITERNIEREKLAKLSQIYDGLCKAINKSHQALNTCHELVEKYRRLDNQDARTALRRQIIASYNRCVVLSRQKRQNRIVCQALHEAGDFHLATGDLKAATKSWLESLDNAFSTLNVGSSWREVLTPAADQFLEGSSTNKDKIAGDELWVGMQCCNVLSKLIMHSSGINLQNAIECALMAAAIFTRFYGCSVPHPTKCFLYGSYRILGQFWPGRKLLADPDRVFPFSLGIMFVLIPEVLLQYEHQYASTAMPIIAGYEYLAESCLEDANHVANARRLRVEALVQCGRFQEAFQVLMNLLRGGATLRNSSGAPELDAVIFHDGKAILDEVNQTALNWLISLNVGLTQAELKKHYNEMLAVHILASLMHLAVALARHESRYDRDAAIARSAAKKIAQSLLSLIKSSEATTTSSQTPRNTADGEAVTEPQSQQSISWEELQLHRIRADIHLQLSYLAFYEGDWNASKASSMDAIGEYNAIPLGSERPRLELEQKLQFSLVFSRGTFLAKCRSQAIACCLAQTHYHAALETAQVAIEEARVTGEEHLRQQLEMQRLQAVVFLGEREKVEREFFALREEALAAHTSGSLTYVRTLQTLSSLLRSKALLTSQSSALNEVYEHLSEAEMVLDALLEHDGWMGVRFEQASAPQQCEKRLNLYRPAIPDFIQVHVDLAQVLLECPITLESEDVHVRQERAQRSIENGIRALDHTTQRMSATKARLLLFRGVLLSKALQSIGTQPIDLDGKLKQRFEECVETFVNCIKSSIEGGYDRQLVRSALIELVNLFGQKLVPGDEDTHVQAAFHYLILALEVQKHESVLFDTLELQNGTITSVEKLPLTICTSINAQSEAIERDSTPPQSCKPPDVGAIVNYFVRLLRMQHILSVSTGPLQDRCALLHSFLVQYHSVYARVACLTDLPSVPSTDPEIHAGLVCALWGQDLAPAIVSASGESTHNTKLTFYFTLGTTRMTIAEYSPTATARMEIFASSPLLSKRCNLDRQCVQRLKSSLSSLRAHIEDEESLLVDRSGFPKIFHVILCKIQQLFRRAEQHKDCHRNKTKDDVQENALARSLRDAFGNPISLECTLEKVRRLEELFSINKGTNVADNELCYFLRDLLD